MSRVTSARSLHQPEWNRDGTRIAYTAIQGSTGEDIYSIPASSNLSGRTEVYLTTFPDAQGRVQVSSGGGSEPVWSRDGREGVLSRRQTHGRRVSFQPA